jgi:serine/threonine protein kinase
MPSIPTFTLKLYFQSNILITDEGKACLCDFGLSNIVVEFLGASYFASTIGGAVRWADPLFYRMSSEEDEAPVVGTSSDIYSFGSVMLEVRCSRDSRALKPRSQFVL